MKGGPREGAVYLGDGLYVDYDNDGTIRVFSYNGVTVLAEVFVCEEVWGALRQYADGIFPKRNDELLSRYALPVRGDT